MSRRVRPSSTQTRRRTRASLAVVLSATMTLASLSALDSCALFPSFEGFGGGEAGPQTDGTATESGRADSAMDDATLDAGGGPDTYHGPEASDEAALDAPRAFDALDASDAQGSHESGPEAGDAQIPSCADVADAGFLFCEDFENGLPMSRWQLVKAMGGESVADMVRPHSGAYSLHSHANPSVADDAGEPNIDTTIGADVVLPSTFYLRAFVFLPFEPTASENFLVLLQNSNPYPGIQLDVQNTTLGLSDFAPEPKVVVNGNPGFPTNRWVCVEWEISSTPPGPDAGAQGSTFIWVDGQQMLSAGPFAVPDLSSGILDLGIAFYPPAIGQAATDFYTDDVLIGASPIGCTE